MKRTSILAFVDEVDRRNEYFLYINELNHRQKLPDLSSNPEARGFSLRAGVRSMRLAFCQQTTKPEYKAAQHNFFAWFNFGIWLMQM